jgi:uncharacterized protein (DUF302 family)
MAYGHSTTLARPFPEVLGAVREALAAQGFGIVSEVDIAATLKNKIGVEIEPQVILGACNPAFANRALEAEPGIGLLLPCNVVVRADGAATVVEMIDPGMLVELTGNPALEPISDEVGQRLGAAMEALRLTA